MRPNYRPAVDCIITQKRTIFSVENLFTKHPCRCHITSASEKTRLAGFSQIDWSENRPVAHGMVAMNHAALPVPFARYDPVSS